MRRDRSAADSRLPERPRGSRRAAGLEDPPPIETEKGPWGFRVSGRRPSPRLRRRTLRSSSTGRSSSSLDRGSGFWSRSAFPGRRMDSRARSAGDPRRRHRPERLLRPQGAPLLPRRRRQDGRGRAVRRQPRHRDARAGPRRARRPAPRPLGRAPLRGRRVSRGASAISPPSPSPSRSRRSTRASTRRPGRRLDVEPRLAPRRGARRRRPRPVRPGRRVRRRAPRRGQRLSLRRSDDAARLRAGPRLSAEPHSFCRVMTGTCWDVLVALFRETQNPDRAAALATAATELSSLVVGRRARRPPPARTSSDASPGGSSARRAVGGRRVRAPRIADAWSAAGSSRARTCRDDLARTRTRTCAAPDEGAPTAGARPRDRAPPRARARGEIVTLASARPSADPRDPPRVVRGRRRRDLLPARTRVRAGGRRRRRDRGRVRAVVLGDEGSCAPRGCIARRDRDEEDAKAFVRFLARQDRIAARRRSGGHPAPALARKTHAVVRGARRDSSGCAASGSPVERRSDEVASELDPPGPLCRSRCRCARTPPAGAAPRSR